MNNCFNPRFTDSDCDEGTTSPGGGTCTPCIPCEAGYEVATPCNATHEAVCKSKGNWLFAFIRNQFNVAKGAYPPPPSVYPKRPLWGERNLHSLLNLQRCRDGVVQVHCYQRYHLCSWASGARVFCHFFSSQHGMLFLFCHWVFFIFPMTLCSNQVPNSDNRIRCNGWKVYWCFYWRYCEWTGGQERIDIVSFHPFHTLFFETHSFKLCCPLFTVLVLVWMPRRLCVCGSFVCQFLEQHFE